MGAESSEPVTPRIWKNNEYGVLPIFCYNEMKSIGDEISLHFFEPRYLKLLRIARETEIYCFIYTNTGHPRMGTTAYICSIHHVSGTDVAGTLRHSVKVKQSWMDREDRLWWCRFQVVRLNPIRPILEANCSAKFSCVSRDVSNPIPNLRFLNHDLPTEAETCDLFYDASEEIRMYSTMCTPRMKKAIIEAATDKNDPEYKSLRWLPSGTIWYMVPENFSKLVNCNDLVGYVERAAKEVTGSTTRNDIVSLLVGLEVSAVKKIRTERLKAEILFASDHVVRCPMSQQPNRPSFIVKVDFGITKGNFKPEDVSLTPDAAKRVLKQVSLKVNEVRIKLLESGHICPESPFTRLPSQIIDHIKSYLIYI